MTKVSNFNYICKRSHNYGLKGQRILAQGNALGLKFKIPILALKGQNKKRFIYVALSGRLLFGLYLSQGVALGYITSAFQAVNSFYLLFLCVLCGKNQRLTRAFPSQMLQT